MGLQELQRLAKALGIPGSDQASVGMLIQSIQCEEGLMPCFSASWSAPCPFDECPCFVGCSSKARVAA